MMKSDTTEPVFLSDSDQKAFLKCSSIAFHDGNSREHD